jgi:hypothetical protein
MNSSKNSSATPSATPVATAPPPRAASSSEADYLHEQAANAKAAFKQTLSEVFAGLGTGVSPAKWTEEHPWLMLASATAVGFTTACVSIPSKEQAALKRLKKLEEMLKEPPPERHHETNGKKVEKKTLTQVLLAELIRAASGIVGSMLRASAGSPTAVGADPSGNDGSHSSQTSM